MPRKMEKRILIADDNRTDRRILKAQLLSAGYAVDEAENGKQALETALASPPDMIISDALMPVMDGFRFCRAIRADHRTRGIPFMLYTGTYTLDEDRDFAKHIGADRFLVKTGDGSLLLDAVRSALAEKRTATGAPVFENPEAARETERLYRERLIRKLEDKVKELEKEAARRKTTENHLSKSRESLKLALNVAGLGMWDWDLKTGKLVFHHQWIDDFSLQSSAAEKFLAQWAERIHPADRARATAALQANLDGASDDCACDYRMTDESGNWRWIKALGRVVERDAAGRALRHVGIFNDISSRKETELNLSKSEEKYRTILENIEEGYFEVDLSGNLVFFNRAMAAILGYDPSELTGLHYKAFMNPENAAKTVDAFHQVYKTGMPSKGYEWQVLRSDGDGRYLEMSVSPIKDAEGRVAGSRGIARDVTERRLMEKFLAETEARYRLLFENAPVGIFHFDRQGVIRACNQACVDICGSSFGKLIGFHLLKEMQNPEGRATIKKCLAGDAAHFEGEYVSVTGGKKTYLKIDAAPVLSKEGVFEGGLVVMEDISERKNAEDALRNSEAQLRALSKHLQVSREQERAAIAREIHDDLGQTLTALKMEVAWLLSKIPESRPELIQKTRESIALIDASIGTVKRVVLDLRPGLLDDLGLSAAIEWQVGEYRKRSGMEMELRIAPEDIFLDNDRSIAVFRVCQEALTNVMRHSGATRVRVRLTRTNGEVVLEVTDNGRGITEQETAKKNSFGLIGMRERVHSFGGTIKIFRNPGGGTTVAMRLPAGK